jgi:hypothetical protein
MFSIRAVRRSSSIIRSNSGRAAKQSKVSESAVEQYSQTQLKILLLLSPCRPVSTLYLCELVLNWASLRSCSYTSSVRKIVLTTKSFFNFVLEWEFVFCWHVSHDSTARRKTLSKLVSVLSGWVDQWYSLWTSHTSLCEVYGTMWGLNPSALQMHVGQLCGIACVIAIGFSNLRGQLYS